MSDTEKLISQVTPYEGDEDYIFVSYSHRDINVVVPILQRLQEEGCRVWYDEGIDPGSEWPESIASHLGRCRVCLAFLSPNSLASQNCRNEIYFAVSKKKDFLSIILEPVQMSQGMELQISTYQSILKYKYRREEQFLQKLLGVELLSACREPRPVEEPPAPEVPQTAPAAAAGEQAAPAPAPTPRPKEKPKKERAPRPASGSADGKKKKLIIAAAAAAAVLVLVLGISTLMGGGPLVKSVTIGDTTYQDDYTFQNVKDASVTADQISKLASFEKCSSLSFINCTLEDGALSALSSNSKIYSVSLTDCQGVSDLTPLSSMPALHILTVDGCGLTDQQAAAIRDLSLTTLDLSRNNLTEVPETADPARVSALSLAGNQISSIDSLSSWTSLTELDVSDNGLDSLSGLEGHQKLKTLRAAGNHITDLTPLSDLIYLSTLDLKNNDVSSLEPLTYCGQLSTVSLKGNTGCTGLDTLSACSSTLTKLNISGISDVGTLDFLNGCVKLSLLCAEDCGLEDCSALKSCPALTGLYLGKNRISDISPLAGLTELKNLDLSGNQLERLPDLGQISVNAVYPIYILSSNSLTSLDNLPRLDYFGLAVDGNPITDLSAISGLDGTYFAFDCTEETPLEPLKDSFSSYLVTSVPVSRQAELESTLFNRTYMTPEEAFDKITDLNFNTDF